MRVTQQVKNILSENREARDSDKVLIRAYFKSHGVEFTPEQERVLFMVSMESITRARRDIQSKGLYPASEGVRRERERKDNTIRQNKDIPPADIVDADPQQLFDDRFYKDLF